MQPEHKFCCGFLVNTFRVTCGPGVRIWRLRGRNPCFFKATPPVQICFSQLLNVDRGAETCFQTMNGWMWPLPRCPLRLMRAVLYCTDRLSSAPRAHATFQPSVFNTVVLSFHLGILFILRNCESMSKFWGRVFWKQLLRSFFKQTFLGSISNVCGIPLCGIYWEWEGPGMAQTAKAIVLACGWVQGRLKTTIFFAK